MPTKDEIQNMPAGREMDALIAGKIMGYKKIVIGSISWWVKESPLAMSYQFMAECADYCPSQDIAAAWQVVEKIKGLCFETQILMWDYSDKVTVCLFPRHGHEEFIPTLTVHAETAPLAICRAALLAVMDGDK
jgi:hypothetical protein